MTLAARVAWQAALAPPGILALLTRWHMRPETAWLAAAAAVAALRAARGGGRRVLAALAAVAWLLLPRRRRRGPALRDGERRAVLITGGASGIGLATARLFHQRGWFVGIYDKNASALQDAQSSLPPAGAPVAEADIHRHRRQLAAGTTCCTGVLDVTDQGSCSAAVHDFCRRSGGRLDCLFNCAGLLNVCDFATETLAAQLAQCSVNVEGVLRMTYAAHAALRATAGARVVTMASLASVMPMPRFSVYCATKASVAHLTEALGVELEGDGITFTDVAVGMVKTPMVSGQADIVRRRARGLASALEDQTQMVPPELVAKTVWRAAHGAEGQAHYHTDALVLMLWWLHGIDRVLGLGLVRHMCKAFGEHV